MEVPLFWHLHASRRRDRESGRHRLVVTDDPEARSPLAAAERSGSSSADAHAPRSRRELLAAGGGLGAAALLAGCTSKVAPPSNVELPKHSPQTGRDVHILNGLLALEYRAI